MIEAVMRLCGSFFIIISSHAVCNLYFEKWD